jgi:ABC-type branched-subunit amino acid transport system substrate-binding protein
MPYKKKIRLVLAATVLMVAAGCGSSSKSSGGTSAAPSVGAAAPPVGGSSGSYKLGVLTDLTGLGATNNFTFPTGIKAGVALAAQEGYKISYVVADTTSSPTGALTAAKKLVEQDHVFAVLADSALAFAAANYLKSKNIPVVGVAEDGNEWITDRNMFSIFGTQDFTKVSDVYGKLFKLLSVSNVGSIGYGISPSSAEAAKNVAASAQAGGLKVGYLNANFPFGGTNAGPAVLAMKNAGVDGFNGSVETQTVFAIINGLRQQNINLKGALMATGYGGDLAQGGPGAEQVAQGVYFLTSYEPVELQTAATDKFQNALKTYAGVKGLPTFGEYNGYIAVDGFVTGLKAAGANPTQASFINAMLGIRSYNAVGLYGSHSVGFAMDQRGQVIGADGCFWVTQYRGSTFHLVAGADPICGQNIPGKTVSASS